MTKPGRQLIRGLSVFDATAIVIGTIIGTGVFLKTATMTQIMGSAGWVLVVWIFAGILSLTGALSYAELASMMPNAGGEYVYLREGYGKPIAFLYGWMRFWIGGPGSIAAYAVGSMTFLNSIYNLDFLGGKAFAAVGVILLFTALNCLAVTFGGKIQTALTALKLVMILGLALCLFLIVPVSVTQSVNHNWNITFDSFPGFAAFGSAMLAALWAYDGWNNLPMVAGEISNPQKNIPRALGLGMLAILVIYLFTNVSYFHVLSVSEIVTSNSTKYPDALPVATKASLTFLGQSGVVILSLAFVLSAVGAMNGSILTGARVPYAMSKDGLFLKHLGLLSEKTAVPVMSILLQGLISIALALSGTFDQLTDYVVFSAWIFYALVTAVVMVLRYKKPDLVRPYKAWGYPVIPIIFIFVAILLLINTVNENPIGSGIGLGLILAGLPVYFIFNRKNQLTG